MLTHLQLRDLVLVDQAELELKSGLTALTGETGAGKSIVVDALLLIAGGRAGGDIVRQGAERAEVAASFDALPPAAEAWLESPYVERQGRFSPDRRWMAYTSNESGRMEVYVRGFMPAGGKWRVSIDGGASPVWRPDGKELFFISSDARLMGVAVRPGAEFDGASAAPLFRIPGELLDVGGVVTQYDVAPDGQSFLLNLDTPSESLRLITLVTNWTSLLRKR